LKVRTAHPTGNSFAVVPLLLQEKGIGVEVAGHGCLPG
jgi:hypothetical protein